MNDKQISSRRYSTALIIIGALVLLYPVLTEVWGSYAQYQLKAKWDNEISRQQRLAKSAERRQVSALGEEAVSNENAVLTKVLSSESGADKANTPFPTTKIKIPKLAVEQVIVEGVDTDALKNGPGHYPGTPVPGQKGNVGIAGHRVTYTHPFNRIDELNSGDEIILETLQYIYTYKVDSAKVLDPNDVSMLEPTRSASLTLTTCNPKYSATQRLDVQAVLVRATPRQRPTILRRVIASFSPSVPEVVPQKSLDLAIFEAKDALKRNPRDYEAHLRLGVAFQAVRQYKKAESEYRKSTELNPGASMPHYQLGLLLDQANKPGRAVEELNTALGLEPGNGKILYKLGNLYIRLKKYDQAVNLLQKGVEQSPYEADTHYYLALALEKSGNRDLAIVHYQEALKFVPDFKEARAGLNRLLSQGNED